MAARVSRHETAARPPLSDRALWARWVVANLSAELLGLGTAALLALAVTPALSAVFGQSSFLPVAGVFLIGGTYEGTLVGVAQWLVLRHRLPALVMRNWTLASAGGAFVAWALGVTPSTVMDLMSAGESEPVQAGPELGGLAVYPLAAALGVVAGIILGGAQWLVLRRHLAGAGRWVVANAAAWAVGMPIIFAGATNTPADAGWPALIVIVVVTVTAAGLAVGAIHGAFLVQMLRRRAGPT